MEAGVAVAGLIAEKTPEGNYQVHADGVEEVVADKGYHSNEVAGSFAEMELRTYIAEPERGERNWKGKQAEKQAVYANRRRIHGPRGKRLQPTGGRESNATSRISSIPAAWTGSMFAASGMSTRNC